MPHSFPLVETIVGGVFFAFILGFIFQRLRMPPLIGYLLAGIVIGPYTKGFTADPALYQQLAELGVILLMFGVGLHFSVGDLWRVKKVALPGAILQILFATLLGLLLAISINWSIGVGIVFGLALSCASTVVLIAALERWNLTDTSRGQIATGWLIVEDIMMVFVLVLIPAMAPMLSGNGSVDLQEVWYLMGKTLLQIIAFIAVMMIIGSRLIHWILKMVVRTGNPQLFRLGVIAIALACAILANYLFGVSFALGAFFAGMILSETEMSDEAEKGSLELRDFFTVLFFVSVGMLFDPTIIIREPLLLIATLLIIIFGKSLAAYFIVKLLGYTKNTALTISAALAQIGEFSFMIASLGLIYKIIPKLANDLILGSALISIILNPLLFLLLNKYQQKQKIKNEAVAISTTETTLEPVLSTATENLSSIKDTESINDNKDDNKVKEDNTTIEKNIVQDEIKATNNINISNDENIGLEDNNIEKIEQTIDIEKVKEEPITIVDEGECLEEKPKAKLVNIIDYNKEDSTSVEIKEGTLVVAPEVSSHTVMVGCGSKGRLILSYLKSINIVVYVQESNLDITNEIRRKQIPVAYGNALAEHMLEAVYIKTARDLIITISNKQETLEIIKRALSLNPNLNIILFCENEEEKNILEKSGAKFVINYTDILLDKIKEVFTTIIANEKQKELDKLEDNDKNLDNPTITESIDNEKEVEKV